MLPSTPQVLGLFNLVIGLMLVASLLFFVLGFIQYLVRLGTWPTYRDQSIELMQWGVSILFTLIVLLMVQQFLSRHLFFTVSAVATIILFAIIYFIIKDSTSGAPAAEHHE